MDTTVLTLRVPADVKDQLDKLAEATHRSKSWLAGEAIKRYLELEAWQIGEISLALKEADAGDFASESEVAAVVGKYASRPSRSCVCCTLPANGRGVSTNDRAP